MYVSESLASLSISILEPFLSQCSFSTHYHIYMGPYRTCFHTYSKTCIHTCSLCNHILHSSLSIFHIRDIFYNSGSLSFVCRFIPCILLYETLYSIYCSEMFGIHHIWAIGLFCWNILSNFIMRIAWIVDFSAKIQTIHVSLSLILSSTATFCKYPWFCPKAYYNLTADILLPKNCLPEHQ